MEIASTLINVFVVVAMGAFLTYMTRERHHELREDIARLETRMDAGFTAMRSEFNAQLGAVRSELNTQLGAVRSEFNGHFSAVRSDITAVALAVGAKAPRPSPQSGTG